jgi:DNA mismatch repair protein MutL
VNGEIRIAGLVERPSDVGTATRRVFISINGRAIRDPGLVRAAETAYRSTIPAGTRPSLFLDVTLPADLVDVNVHPAKAEVRFRDRWTIERAVEAAVRRALGTVDSAASFGYRFANTNNPFVVQDAGPVGTDLLASRPSFDEPLFATTHHGNDVAQGQEFTAVTTSVTSSPDVAYVPDERVDVEGDVVPTLTQLRRTFIMFEHEEGIVLIDQHSAHERVLYEKFMHMLNSGAAPSQRLLLPFTLHVGSAEANAFEENREYFERLGFEIDGFGGNSLLVNAVPVPHPRFDAERCLRETLEALSGSRFAGTHTRHERLAATVACKAAVKAGDSLSQQEMRALFIALRDTQLPAHDVHGRSTIVQLSWSEVERRFGRT